MIICFIVLKNLALENNISFSLVNDWLQTDLNSISKPGDISLFNFAYIDTSSNTAGNISTIGKNITLDEGLIVIANTSQNTDNSI